MMWIVAAALVIAAIILWLVSAALRAKDQTDRRYDQ